MLVVFRSSEILAKVNNSPFPTDLLNYKDVIRSFSTFALKRFISLFAVYLKNPFRNKKQDSCVTESILVSRCN